MDSNIENVYNKYRPKLIKTANKILYNEEDAEDVVQKAFLKTLRINIKDFEETELLMYMYKAVKNMAYDVYNSKKHEDEKTEKLIVYSENNNLVREEDSTYTSVLDGVYSDYVKKHMDSLDNCNKEILYLSIFENMSSTQIANKLGLDKEVVKKRIQRGKKKLGKMCHDMFRDS